MVALCVFPDQVNGTLAERVELEIKESFFSMVLSERSYSIVWAFGLL